MPKLFFRLALMLFLAAPALAANLRCQGDLMTPGTIMAKVRAKCGEPVSDVRVGEKTVRTSDGQERLLYITEMTYQFSGGYYVLTFEGGVLKKTEYYQQ